MQNVRSLVNQSIVLVLLIGACLQAQSGNIDTSWVAHYTSGRLPGTIQFVANATDASGNVYVTGNLRNMFTGEDFIVIKFDPDGVEQWRVQYDGPDNAYDKVEDLCVDAAGNVYLAGGSDGIGTSRDYVTIKYNTDGIQQWISRYDGPASEAWDKATAIAVDGDGNVYVTGGSDKYSDTDYATIKYDANGVEQWVTRYDGPDNEGDDTAYYLELDAAGNVYVSGRSDGNGTKDDYATIKYANDGTRQWVARYSGPANKNDQVSAMAVDDSGNVFVTGKSVNAQSKWDWATVKYDSAGYELWHMRYTGPANSNDHAEALTVGDSGYVYVTGNSMDNGTGNDFTTIKYSSSGAERWVARYNSASNGTDKATVIEKDAAGNLYVAGQSEGTTLVKYTPGGTEIWTAHYSEVYSVNSICSDPAGNIHLTGGNAATKFDDAGNQHWAALIEPPALSFEQPQSMAMDLSGNVYVAGNSRGMFTDMDFMLLKYSPDGSQQWVRMYNGPDSSSDDVADMEIDDAGNIYITGSSNVFGTDHDWATVKYNNDGVEQWVSRLDGAGNYYDGAKALAVDNNGNVFVTGFTSQTASIIDRNMTTAKYDASGIEKWVVDYDGSAANIDEGAAIALDAAGNIYITGTAESAANGSDIVTIKYNGQGVEQWVSVYDGPANSTDKAVSIKTDNQNNVIICGASTDAGSNLDYVTIKYNSDGSEQWVRRYSGSGNGLDTPVDMVVDDSAAVYVTGYIYSSYGEDDFMTVKYDAAGNQKWTSKYDGPIYSSDRPASITLGPAGSVYVSGYSTGFGHLRDFATVKINADGYRDWVVRYDSGSDAAVACVTDGQGHIYVTGHSVYTYDTESVCTTIKYTEPVTGLFTMTESLVPEQTILSQNYPNPFNPKTTIRYELAKAGTVRISIFNVLGQEVAKPVEGFQKAGLHAFRFDGSGLPAGVYFYRLETEGISRTRRMLLLK